VARVKICLTTNNQQKILADLTAMTHLKFDGIAPRSLSLAIAAALLSLANPWLTTTAALASTFAYEGFDYEPEDRENSLLNGVGTSPFPPSRSNERLFIGSPHGQLDRPLNFGMEMKS
jgi:hypothetical protein